MGNSESSPESSDRRQLVHAVTTGDINSLSLGLGKVRKEDALKVSIVYEKLHRIDGEDSFETMQNRVYEYLTTTLEEYQEQSPTEVAKRLNHPHIAQRIESELAKISRTRNRPVERVEKAKRGLKTVMIGKEIGSNRGLAIPAQPDRTEVTKERAYEAHQRLRAFQKKNRDSSDDKSKEKGSGSIWSFSKK